MINALDSRIVNGKGYSLNFRIDDSGQPYCIRRKGEHILVYNSYGQEMKVDLRDFMKDTYPVDVEKLLGLCTNLLGKRFREKELILNPLDDLE